jgi:DnaD/phage-associated family protein
LFFSDLLPVIDDLAELKVTIYAFWALSQQDGKVRFLRLTDFLNDPVFINGLGPTSSLASQALIAALERAVARGTFLHIEVEGADGHLDLYFLNSERGRAAVEGITKGEWRPWPDEEEPITLLVERPNIFVLYEQNIGALTPLIADELRDAEQNYPVSWIEEAIKIAVENNVRRWRYISAILEKWREHGKQEQDGISRRDTKKQLREQIPKEYEDIVKR